MRKWMRDRLQRRKKKDEPDSSSTPQVAPLQPAYPDEVEGPAPGTELTEAASAFAEPQASAAEEPGQDAAPSGNIASGPRPEARRGRSRRRRRKPGAGGATDTGSAARPPAVKPLQPAYELDRRPARADIAPELKAAHPAPPAADAPRPARPPRGVVVLAIGLPGSGKSSWFKRRGVNPLSSDMLRTILFDDITQQRYQDLVFSTLRALLRARLIAKMPWNYVDATNLSPHERRGWIKMSKDYGFEVHALFFDVPVEICMQRNQRRGRIVPDDVMQRMGQKLRAPTFDEGFSKITVVRVKRALAQAAEEPPAE